MTKLAKFLKPFIFAIILLVILVFTQAMCDLKLPDLMSGIVNNGLAKVEYSFDQEKLHQALSDGEFPELQAYINIIDFDSVSEQMKESILNNNKTEDIDPKTLGIIHKMMELEIIKSNPNPDKELILKTGGFMLLITLLSGVTTITVSFLASRVSIGAGAGIRKGIFTHIEKFTRFEMNKFGTASLITRTTNDVVQIQTAIFMIFRMALRAPITFISGVVMATRKSPSLAMNLVYIIPILIIIIIVVARKAMRLFKAQQIKLDKLNNIARESITGVRTIRAYNKIEHEEARFDKANINLMENSLKVNRLMAILMPIVFFIMHMAIVLIIWSGAKQVDIGNIQTGDIIAFIQYSFHILFSFMMLAMMFVLLPRAAASADRINEVLCTEISIKEPEQWGRFSFEQRLYPLFWSFRI